MTPLFINIITRFNKYYFILLNTNSQYRVLLLDIVNKKEVKKMKPLKSKVSITLDEDVINEIKKLAEEDDRSFSQYINLILKEYLKSLD